MDFMKVVMLVGSCAALWMVMPWVVIAEFMVARQEETRTSQMVVGAGMFVSACRIWVLRRGR